MKRYILAAILAAGFSKAPAQFSIDWYTIDGGGGTSTNQSYAISGTIGQPDASAAMVGGSYSIAGGFWPALSVIQTPDAPVLSLHRAGGNLVLSWSPSPAGFVLQQSTLLSTGTWQNAPSGPTNPVVVPAGVPYQFYRLHKP